MARPDQSGHADGSISDSARAMPEPDLVVPPAILFEDNHLLIVSKPAGLLGQGKPGAEPTLEDRIRSYLCPDDPSSLFLGTVHRLDRPVSGVLVWARTEKAARRLSEQFAARVPRKTYLAVVARARPDSAPLQTGVWEDAISDVGEGGVARLTPADEPGSKPASTEVRILAGTGPIAIELRPRTGRTHQLRVQCAGRGWPIAGDTRYGSLEAPPASGAIGLHARRLEFDHPMTGRRMNIEAPLPPCWSGWGGASLFGSENGLS